VDDALIGDWVNDRNRACPSSNSRGQLVDASASGDLRATQSALSLLPSPQEKAAPRKTRRIGKEDSPVVAEIIRRAGGREKRMARKFNFRSGSKLAQRIEF
jgi:hypothetical protein